ncbi:MAG: methyltransferase domain-containing protein [Rhodothermales bacterium]
MNWSSLRYSLYSPVYDLLAAPLAGARRRAVTLAAVRPGDRVLIVGCGTGLDLPLLPEGCHVTAVDLSGPMLNSMRRRARALGMTVESYRMNAQNLGFTDAWFDVVLVHLIAAVVPDGKACLQEATRVLKPGGTLSLMDKFRSDDREQPGLVRRVLNIPASLLFSDINRRWQDLVAGLPLEVEANVPAAFGGIWRAIRLTKTPTGPS